MFLAQAGALQELYMIKATQRQLIQYTQVKHAKRKPAELFGCFEINSSDYQNSSENWDVNKPTTPNTPTSIIIITISASAPAPAHHI